MSVKKILWFIFLSLIFFLIFSNKVSANTIIDDSNSVIENDTHWIKASSPYIIQAEVLVNPGITLTIDSGVIVKFDYGTSLNIFGNLVASGTSSEKIFFTSLADDEVNGDTNQDGESLGFAGDWAGVYVMDGGIFQMANVSIHYADDPVYIDSSSGEISNSEFLHNNNGLSFWNGSTVIVDSSIIDDVLRSPVLAAFSSSVALDKSEIKNFYFDQIYVFDNSSIIFNDSKISNSFGGGIEVFSDSYLSFISSMIENINGSSIFTLSDNSHLRIDKSQVSSTEYNNQTVDLSGPGSNAEVSDSFIKGPGFNGLAAYDHADLNVKNTEISGFTGSAFYLYQNSNTSISESNVFNNQYGIQNHGAGVNISQSSVYNNPGYGILNDAEGSLIATNNWWGDQSGPFHQTLNPGGLGNEILGDVTFTPWLTQKPSGECCSNVIFLPGIEASRLYKQQVFENQLWEPNITLNASDSKKLYLNPDGTSVDKNIYTRDIIKRTNSGMGILDINIYKNFAESMDFLVASKVINKWEAFPYDWRFGVEDIINDGVKMQNEVVKIIPKIESMAISSMTGKVTLITHSNGGLFAKALINKLKEEGKEKLIDRLIMVASPAIGTPTAIGGLLQGEEQGFGGPMIFPSHVARTLGENMEAAYGLIPTKKYFDTAPDPVVTFDSSVDKVANFRTKYGDKITSYSTLSDFLLGKDGRSKPSSSDLVNPNILNKSLLNQAESLHNTIDNWILPSNIELTQIAGWGLATTKGIRYFGKEICTQDVLPVCSYVLDHELISTVDGDGTVLSASAVSSGENKYYVNVRDYNRGRTNVDHKAILETSYLEDFIKNIIQNKNSALPLYITKEKPADSSSKNTIISMHSPVSIDAYDSAGRHTGLVLNPNPNSDLEVIEASIPNSSYKEVGEGKYLYLDSESSSTIKLQGLDSGTFTLNIATSQGGSIISDSTFTDIPTNPNMEGQVVINSTSTPKLLLDVEGDGKIDVAITPNTEIDPITFLNIIKKTLDGFDITPKVKTALIKRIDSIINAIEKGKIKNTIKKVKDFSKKLKSFDKKKVKKNIHKKINKDDANTMVNMLSELLDLLEAK